jgi:epoxide hydrolase-like predicted phosphatase
VASSIEAVVFDFGGVIISPLTITLGKVASGLGVERDRFARFVMGPFEESTDHPWHRLERGHLELVDLQGGLEELAPGEGITLAGDEVERIMAHDAFVIHTEVLDRIRRLRAEGLRTGLLTNSTAAFRPTLEEICPPELFDVYVDSSEVGMRKPERGIYELVLERLGGLEPDRVVYLDDFPANLAMAAEVGMRTLLFGEPKATLAELDVLLAA